LTLTLRSAERLRLGVRHALSVAATYDTIGVGYSKVRRPDARLGGLIGDALGDARSVLDVGAGAGSYEPAGRQVVAVDPSSVMLSQHPGPRRVRAMAESLPFADGSFDAAMAILTVHHWSDVAAGVREMRRVARRQVVFTWDPAFERELWIVEEYVPAVGVMERARFPTIADLVQLLEAHTVRRFEIPFDFADGYQAAFWRRPEAYLDREVRAASSTFAVLSDEIVEPAMERLRVDLDSGVWADRHRDLLAAESMDYGHRLIIAG
jgi:SAM-dependent methyltransferase